MNYNTVDENILEKLKAIVGSENVLTSNMEAFSHDESPKEKYSVAPEVVVKPAAVEEICAVVILANECKIPVTPRGSGTGLSGGAIPVRSGIVISLERLNRIIEVDYDNMTVTVECGVIPNDINDIVKEKGFFYAGYPMSYLSCSIGGNIAENAGGGKAVKYGVTSKNVLGLEVVTPMGKVVRLGGKIIKDVTGYDLKQVIIGSEGTLGIVTKAILKLLPIPKAKSGFCCFFTSTVAAISCVPKIIGLGEIPASIEYMDKFSFDASSEYIQSELKSHEAEGVLIVEYEGNNKSDLDKMAKDAMDICKANHAIKTIDGSDIEAMSNIWAVRSSIADGYNSLYPINSIEDISVPIACIPEALVRFEQVAADHTLIIACCGHAGDGNLHVTLFKPNDLDMETWGILLDKSLHKMYEITYSLGGKLSGEHGIGYKRKKYFHAFVNEDELELMTLLKKAWDPNYIMNPEKIFDITD